MLLFEKKNPEECGIPAEAVRAMEARMERLGIRMHGYLLLKGKNILAERYWEPYNQYTNHRMYSVTKSLVALAVGLLQREGKLSLDDKICSYFPEMLPEGGAHPWCGEMTIRDMLTMRTCYASTTYKRYEGSWTESFFRVKPDHVPGTVFSYDTSSSHTLAALIEKLTGMDMLDYLREKAFNRLGFSKEAYVIKDSYGVSQGGSGLMCTLRDMASAAYLCNQGGILEGEELLPPDFLREAVCCQVPTDLQPTLDEQCGYGYMIWKPREEGFVFYGMGGQLAVCFPKLDFCFVTMADTIGNPAGLQMIYDCFYDTVYPCAAKDWKGNQAERGLLERGVSFGEQLSQYEAELSAGFEKREAQIRKSSQKQIYTFYENPMECKEVSFDWEESTMTLVWENKEWKLSFGEEWVCQKLPGTDYDCRCRGIWKQGHFVLWCYVTDEEQGHVAMDFAWKDERLSVRMKNTGEEFFANMSGFGSAGK